MALHSRVPREIFRGTLFYVCFLHVTRVGNIGGLSVPVLPAVDQLKVCNQQIDIVFTQDVPRPGVAIE